MNKQDLLYFNALALVSRSKSTLILSHNSQTYMRVCPSVKPHEFAIVSYTNKLHRFKLPFRVFRFKDEDIEFYGGLMKGSILIDKCQYDMYVPRIKY